MVKTLDDVLLSIGTIVKVVETDNETTNNYMIIGKRILNVETRNVWDYIGVPSEEGFRLAGKKEHMENNNCYYFNHTDIVSVIERN